MQLGRESLNGYSGKTMMFPLKCALFSLGCLTTASLIAETEDGSSQGPQHSNWDIFWQDEFSGTELDERKWTLCKRGNYDWNNSLSADPRLLKVTGGALHLQGIVNDQQATDPVPFVTGGVTSKRKFAFQYGKAQVRARFKSAQGAWPAIWMLGSKGAWPAKGEIDLMEHLNFDNLVYQSVHSQYTTSNDKHATPKSGGTAKIERDAWNTYGCEWEERQITFTVNGKPTHTYPRKSTLGKAQWPFRQSVYFILSMQIGGDWVNHSGPTNPAHFPAGMEIDWVRVYKRKTSPKAKTEK